MYGADRGLREGLCHRPALCKFGAANGNPAAVMRRYRLAVGLRGGSVVLLSRRRKTETREKGSVIMAPCRVSERLRSVLWRLSTCRLWMNHEPAVPLI